MTNEMPKLPREDRYWEKLTNKEQDYIFCSVTLVTCLILSLFILVISAIRSI